MIISLQELTCCGFLVEAQIHTKIVLGLTEPRATVTFWRLTSDQSELWMNSLGHWNLMADEPPFGVFRNNQDKVR